MLNTFVSGCTYTTKYVTNISDYQSRQTLIETNTHDQSTLSPFLFLALLKLGYIPPPGGCVLHPIFAQWLCTASIYTSCVRHRSLEFKELTTYFVRQSVFFSCRLVSVSNVSYVDLCGFSCAASKS